MDRHRLPPARQFRRSGSPPTRKFATWCWFEPESRKLRRGLRDWVGADRLPHVRQQRKQLAVLSGSVVLHHWHSAGIAAFRRAYPSLRMARGLIVAPVDTVRDVSDHAVVVPWDLVR